jgi:delta 1-pyrroline-5-carboxylate dehydrogenase
MAYTLGEAARATGKTKAAIWQAIAAQRIPASKDERNRWQIDPGELFKIYPPSQQARRKESKPSLANENGLLVQENRHLRETIKRLEEWLAERHQSVDFWMQYSQRLLACLSEERRLQLEKWKYGTPTVIEVPPASPEQVQQGEQKPESTVLPKRSGIANWLGVGFIFAMVCIGLVVMVRFGVEALK